MMPANILGLDQQETLECLLGIESPTSTVSSDGVELLSTNVADDSLSLFLLPCAPDFTVPVLKSETITAEPVVTPADLKTRIIPKSQNICPSHPLMNHSAADCLMPLPQYAHLSKRANAPEIPPVDEKPISLAPTIPQGEFDCPLHPGQNHFASQCLLLRRPDIMKLSHGDQKSEEQQKIIEEIERFAKPLEKKVVTKSSDCPTHPGEHLARHCLAPLPQYLALSDFAKSGKGRLRCPTHKTAKDPFYHYASECITPKPKYFYLSENPLRYGFQKGEKECPLHPGNTDHFESGCSVIRSKRRAQYSPDRSRERNSDGRYKHYGNGYMENRHRSLEDQRQYSSNHSQYSRPSLRNFGNGSSQSRPHTIQTKTLAKNDSKPQANINHSEQSKQTQQSVRSEPPPPPLSSLDRIVEQIYEFN
jgi:hypothetical protein